MSATRKPPRRNDDALELSENMRIVLLLVVVLVALFFGFLIFASVFA